MTSPSRTKENRSKYSKKKYKENIELSRKNSRETHRRNKKQIQNKYLLDKRKCLGYYSKGSFRCACCGESEYMFLTIDHINNDGAKHRREIGSNNMYQWLVIHLFPDDLGLQVLCFNCNYGKRINNGVCPHMLDRDISDK